MIETSTRQDSTYSQRIRWFELHRWLNPFAKQRAVMVTPLTPKEIEDTLRPHLWSYRWSSPFNGLYGALRPWGFRLQREMFGQPCLTARYQPGANGTELQLVFGRTTWGIIGWFWAFIVWPYAIWSTSRTIRASDSTLWTSPTFNNLADRLSFVDESVWITFVAIAAVLSISTHVVNSASSRNDLRFFRDFLSDELGATDVLIKG